jgi:hypothetical protein
MCSLISTHCKCSSAHTRYVIPFRPQHGTYQQPARQPSRPPTLKGVCGSSVKPISCHVGTYVSVAEVPAASAAGGGTAVGASSAAGGWPTLSTSLRKDCMVVGAVPPAWRTSHSVSCGAMVEEVCGWGACGVWGVECGVWGVECGVWSVGCGVWSVECGVRVAAGRNSEGLAQVRSRLRQAM